MRSLTKRKASIVATRAADRSRVHLKFTDVTLANGPKDGIAPMLDCRIRLIYPVIRHTLRTLVFFAVTPYAFVGCERPPTLESTVADAPLLVEPTTLDMGDLLPGVPVVKSVRLTNRSLTPLRVTKAIADCGCTTPSWPDSPIAPGESVDTTVEIEAGTEQGVTLTKRVTYMLENGSPTFLTVTGKVGMFLRFSPSSFTAPSNDDREGWAAPAVIQIESADGEQFSIASLSPDIATAGSAERSLTQTVALDWSRWLEAGKPMRLEISTDHSKAPTLSVLIRRPIAKDVNE